MEELIDKILRLPLETSQEEMQEHLYKLFIKSGMEKVLEVLFNWELKTDYINEKKLYDNLKLKFFDKEYGITFRLQINFARSKYRPTLPVSEETKNLHCPICFENIGLPGKKNLRAFVFPLDGKNRIFFIQATPFPLFPLHFVLINMEKIPQKIDVQTLEDLFNFSDLTPHYTNCSNSDLEWTGASILKHMHYQIFGGLHLPVMESAQIENFTIIKEHTEISVIHYPCAVIKLKSGYRGNIINIMDKLIQGWKAKNRKKNSVNIIIKRSNDFYEGYIFLRNSDFRTPKEIQRFKTEGIGIIEMAGEAILPVPESENENEVVWKWNTIKNNGNYIIKGIIEGNSPIKEPEETFSFIKEIL